MSRSPVRTTTAPRTGRGRPAARTLASVTVSLLLAIACSSTATPTAPDVASPGTAATSPSSSSPASPAAGTEPGAADGSAGASVAARPSDGCRRPSSVTKGSVTDEVIDVAGATRTTKRYVPSTATGTDALPLVVDLHGYSEGAAVHTVMSNMSATAEAHGFVVLTPQGSILEYPGGQVPYWNSFGSSQPDDVGFIEALLDATEAQLCIDTARVYVTGLSNGAFMTSYLACRLADRIAAGAPVAGLQFPPGCRPARAIPLVAFHGTADEYVTWDGRRGTGVARLPGAERLGERAGGELRLQPIPDAQADWARAEGCEAEPRRTPVAAQVELVSYSGCRDGSAIDLYVIDGGGHAWPGSQFSASIANVVGPTTMEIDANELMWAFFERHPLP